MSCSTMAKTERGNDVPLRDDLGKVRHPAGGSTMMPSEQPWRTNVLSEGTGSQGRVHLLEMEIADPIGVFGDQFDRTPP